MNLIFERELTSGADTEMEYAWQYRYRLGERFEPGVEMYGGLGDWGHMGSFNDHEQQVGPAASASCARTTGAFKYEVGLLFGAERRDARRDACACCSSTNSSGITGRSGCRSDGVPTGHLRAPRPSRPCLASPQTAALLASIQSRMRLASPMRVNLPQELSSTMTTSRPSMTACITRQRPASAM